MSTFSHGLKAVLFDLDGVIIDSEPLHVKALQVACAHYGFKLLPEDIVRFKGLTEARVARHFIDAQTKTPPTCEDFIAYKSAIYTRLVADELTIFDGVLDFMNLCRAQSWRIGLTTSALPENAASVLRKFHLARYFDVMVTGGDVEHGKPHPEPYLKTAQRLGVSPQDCLVIEDSLNGVRSGKSAGCRVLALTTSFTRHELEHVEADLIVDSFAEARQRLFGSGAQQPT